MFLNHILALGPTRPREAHSNGQFWGVDLGVPSFGPNFFFLSVLFSVVRRKRRRGGSSIANDPYFEWLVLSWLCMQSHYNYLVSPEYAFLQTMPPGARTVFNSQANSHRSLSPPTPPAEPGTPRYLSKMRRLH
jgi:hypothetical protein